MKDIINQDTVEESGPILDLYWVWLEMVKNGICLGGASKQNAPFLKKFSPKNASVPLISRIGPESFKAWFSAI